MSERLRARDLAFLTGESPTTPHHNATIEIFEPGPDGFSFDRFVALVEDRIAFVPRYRQRIAFVPGRLANPVWVDDTRFDLGYHVRRSALPRPGNLEQLRQLASRIVSRPLDRQRPLWEIYVVEGLEHGRVALLHKTHQVLVDGIVTVDLGQVLLDGAPEVRTSLVDTTHDDTSDHTSEAGPVWSGRRPASASGLLLSAAVDTLTRPETAVDAVRGGARSLAHTLDSTRKVAGRVVGGLAGRPAERGTALAGALSQQRRVVTAETPLESYRRVREAHGGSINDVILATVAGGLRAWLMTRDPSLGGVQQVRAVVPVSVIDRGLESTSLGSPVDAHFVDLPIGEPSPVVRLHQVSYSFRALRGGDRAVGAERLTGIAGFAPITFHAVGSRVAAAELRRGFQLSVTNVPGPQAPLYAAGARMVATYPVPPLLPAQTLAVGVTSYDGGVYYGITADRDRVPDADVLAQCVLDALDELLDTAGGRRVPQGRRRPAKQGKPARKAARASTPPADPTSPTRGR